MGLFSLQGFQLLFCASMQPRDRFAEVWVIFQWSWVWFPLILIYQVPWAHCSLLGVGSFLEHFWAWVPAPGRSHLRFEAAVSARGCAHLQGHLYRTRTCKSTGERRRHRAQLAVTWCLWPLQRASLQQPCAEVRSSAASFACR